MITKEIHLKELYPFLAEGGEDVDPVLEVMVQIQALDVKRPAVIVCPGGGYAMRCSREAEPIALEYMADGANGFVLQYSVSPARYPQQLLEVAAAVDYISKNADELNIDPEKIAILGFSAGGHVAASYCTMYNREEVQKHIKARPVNASILCYAVISALVPTHHGSFQCLSGCEELTDEQKEYFSCEKHILKDTPPTFLWAASDDTCVPVCNTYAYAYALSQHKIPAEVHVYPTGNHGIASCKFGTCDKYDENQYKYDSQWTKLSRRWLKRVFNF